MVLKGQGKSAEGCAAPVVRPQAAKFLGKPQRAPNSQHAPSTNSSTAGAHDYSRLADTDTQEEFQRLCSQLVELKDKVVRDGNHLLLARLSAMQEALHRPQPPFQKEEDRLLEATKDHNPKTMEVDKAETVDSLAEPADDKVLGRRSSRPHALVIDLGDKNCFTEEVTV